MLPLRVHGCPDRLDIVNTVFDGPNELYINGDVAADTLIRIQNAGNTNPDLLDVTFVAVPAAAAEGTLIPAWNACRVDIGNFYH